MCVSCYYSKQPIESRFRVYHVLIRVRNVMAKRLDKKITEPRFLLGPISYILQYQVQAGCSQKAMNSERKKTDEKKKQSKRKEMEIEKDIYKYIYREREREREREYEAGIE